MFDIHPLTHKLNTHAPLCRFREKYHPEESKPLREEVNRRKREEVLVKFKAEFAQGKYDDVNYDASKAAEETKEEGGKEDEIKDEGGNPDTAVVADDVMIVDEPVAAESAENSKEDGEKKEETKPEDAKPEEPIFALFIKAIQSTIKRSELLEVSILRTHGLVVDANFNCSHLRNASKSKDSNGLL